jgi:hypothetical protein
LPGVTPATTFVPYLIIASDDVEIRLSTNRPIKLSFPITYGRLEYLVAPRMD